MCAAGTKQNKYVDKFFDLLTNWFISICFFHATFVSRQHTFILHPFRWKRERERRANEQANGCERVENVNKTSDKHNRPSAHAQKRQTLCTKFF